MNERKAKTELDVFPYQVLNLKAPESLVSTQQNYNYVFI